MPEDYRLTSTSDPALPAASPSTATAGKGTVPGALGATALVVLGSQLDDAFAKALITYSGPALAGMGSYAWSRLAPFLEGWLVFRHTQREIQKWLSDPRTPQPQKDELAQQLQQLRQAYVAHLQRPFTRRAAPASPPPRAPADGRGGR